MAAEPTNPDSHPHAVFIATAPALAALTQLEQGFGARAPFVLLTGHDGMGKRTLARESLRRLSARATTAHLPVPAPDAAALSSRLLVLFGGRELPGKSAIAVLERLLEVLANATSGGRVAVLVVPSAHALSAEQLNELKRIAMAAAHRQCPLELWLLALPALEPRLDEPSLAGVLEQLSLRCQPAPLTSADIRHYLHVRPMAAGELPHTQFSRKACRDIHAATGGVPGAVEAIAAEAARRAARASASTVSPEHVRAAASTLRSGRVASGVADSEAPPQRAAKPVAKLAQPATTLVRPAAAAPPRLPVKAKSEPRLTPLPASPCDDGFTPSSDPRVQDWVSRFGGGSSVRVGANYTQPLTAAELMEDAACAAAGNTTSGDDAEAFLRPNSLATPPPRPRGRPLGQRAPRVPRIAIGALVAVLLLALLIAQRRGLVRYEVQATEASTITREDAAVVEPEFKPATEAVRARRAARRAAAEGAAESAATGRFGVAVGTFLNRDMARAEEEHLSRLIRYKVWITSASVQGVRSYRLMIGTFDTVEKAEVAAQSLMRRGLLRDASVVALPAGRRSR